MLLALLVLLVVERAFWVVVELLDDLRLVLDGRERLVVGIVLFTNWMGSKWGKQWGEQWGKHSGGAMGKAIGGNNQEKCESSETIQHNKTRQQKKYPLPPTLFSIPPFTTPKTSHQSHPSPPSSSHCPPTSPGLCFWSVWRMLLMRLMVVVRVMV